MSEYGIKPIIFEDMWSYLKEYGDFAPEPSKQDLISINRRYIPVMGAGLGMGINVGNLIAGMANQIVRTQQSSNNQQPIICSKSSWRQILRILWRTCSNKKSFSVRIAEQSSHKEVNFILHVEIQFSMGDLKMPGGEAVFYVECVVKFGFDTDEFIEALLNSKSFYDDEIVWSIIDVEQVILDNQEKGN